MGPEEKMPRFGRRSPAQSKRRGMVLCESCVIEEVSIEPHRVDQLRTFVAVQATERAAPAL